MQEGSLDVTVDLKVSRSMKTTVSWSMETSCTPPCTAPNTAILLHQIPLDLWQNIPDLGQLIFLWDYRTEDPVKRQETYDNKNHSGTAPGHQ